MLGTVVIISVLIVTFTYIVTQYQSDFLHKEALKQAQNRSKTLAALSKVWILSNDYEGLEEVVKNLSIYDDITFAAVINMDGKIIAHTDISQLGKFVADEKRIKYIKKVYKKHFTHHFDTEEILFQNENYIDIIRIIHEDNNHIGFVNLRINQHLRQENIENTINKGILFTVISVLIGILFAYFTSKSLINQLLRLIETMKQIKHGNKNITADEEGVHEIAELSHEFNTMLKELHSTEDLNKTLHERLELVFTGNKDGLWDWNLIDNSVYFSPLWKEMLGYKDNEIDNILENWSKRVHPHDLDNALIAVQNHIEGKTPLYQITLRMQHKDSHWIWVLSRGKASYDDAGKAIRIVGTHTDVTQEKEEQLKNAHQAQIIEQTVDSIISTDLEGWIINYNSGSEHLLGFKASEIVGKNIDIIYNKYDKEFLKKSNTILIETGEFSTDTNYITKEKKLIPVSLSLTLLRDEKGEPISVVYYSKDITERKIAERELHHQKDVLDYQAHHDVLTELPNRLLFYDRLTQAIEKAKRNDNNLAILFIDLDRFKQINDSLGHSYGDEVLKIVTKRLLKVIRKEDTLARLGGDEFTILMEELKNSEDASCLANKILKTLEKPVFMDGNTLYVSSSIGISLFPEDDVDATNLLKYADVAMYKAKDEGRNNFQFYSSEMTEIALEYISLGASLRQALANEEFVIYYQAQTNALKDEMIGAEALVRWIHPQRGLISPDKFIPFAEESGLIIELDRWVMKTAMMQWSEWYMKDLNPGVLALNLSMKQLQKEDFIETLHKMIIETTCKPEWLELEVTESQVMTHPEKAIILLKKISDMGIELAVDDFGTGYSSLSYLKRLPINKLKIDQSFIHDIPHDEEDVGITKAVIALSQSLNLSVIAEGVETKEQKDFLVNNGCINIQGYFYGKPMPKDEMQLVLKKIK
jgi:diguanylate cyclase (GGDEF)-like protein/PAS domain S-box-containing protein